VVSVILPEKPGLIVPTNHAVREVIGRVAAAELAPPPSEAAERPLLDARPTPGKAEQVAQDAALGTTTWRLSNGATVILKPTSIQADEILMEAFSPGGTSVVDDASFIPAITATGLQRRSGLGEHDTLSLLRLLAGRKADVESFIGGQSEGLSGLAGKADLELMLQQVHLMFTEPRFDASALELERSRREEDLRNRASSPAAWLWDTYAELLWQGNERYTNWDIEDVAALDLAASERVFRDRFSNPGDWTFVFVGSTTAAELIPHVETWIASLPDAGRREAPRDDGARMVKGVVTQTLPAGDTPRAHVVLEFHGELEATWTSRATMSAVGEVLQSALREELREDRGGTYGVRVDADLTDGPVETFQVRIDFECDPDRVDELIEATWDVVDLVRSERVLDSGITIMRSQRAHDREEDEGSNGFWAGEITGALQRGEDPRDILTFEARNAALNGAAIRELARRVLDKENHLLLIQRPEAAPR
jgi:zinc protease